MAAGIWWPDGVGPWTGAPTLRGVLIPPDPVRTFLLMHAWLGRPAALICAASAGHFIIPNVRRTS